MNLSRIFIRGFDGALISDAGTVKHISTVLRLRAGDTFAGYDGENEWILKILSLSGSEAKVEVINKREIPPACKREVTLAPALIKTSAWELLIEKAVELGASAILPVESERSLFREKDKTGRQNREKKIMESSVAQCAGRMPKLETPVRLAEIIERTAAIPNRFIFSASAETDFTTALSELKPGAIVLFTGPEGDWTEKEIATATAAGCIQVKLGNRILRSETAAVAALAVAVAIQT